MKFRDVFDKIKPFASVAAAFIPGGPAVLELVNAVLPEDQKLPTTATGHEILSAVEKLPPDQRASLMEKEIDLEIAREEGWTDRYKAMCAADGQSTRPQIALLITRLLVFEVVAFCAILGYQAYESGLDSVADSNLWTIFAVLTAIPAEVLRKYFGELRREQQNRLGVPNQGPLGELLGRFGLG